MKKIELVSKSIWNKSVTLPTTRRTMQSMHMNTTTDYWTATAMAATKTKTKTPITIYHDDGSMYQGHVNEDGEKHGQGTLKTGIYITGVVGDENSHLMKWTEFSGNWFNGVMHGTGVMRKMSGNGDVIVVHDGMWAAGVPIINPAPVHVDEDDENPVDEDDENQVDEDDDEYYRGCSSPRRGDYDHHEEAS
jgi:hypothetical protein